MKSKQPRKQRKELNQAPLHKRHKKMAAHLDKTLRKKYKRRAFPVRKGDTVKVLRGSSKGRSGKVAEVNLENYYVGIEGIARKKSDGTEVMIPIHPSNLMLTELDLKDGKRVRSLERNIKGVASGK